MTFHQAAQILRQDILAEDSQEYFTDADLLDFLYRSSEEMARALQFPTDVGAVVVAKNAVQFNLPADAATAELNEVSFEGFQLELRPLARVLEYQGYTGLKQPRYYNYDPKRSGLVVRFAPAAPTNGTFTFEYVLNYTASSPTAEVWTGLFKPFHELVVFRAGEKAFRASLEFDKADATQQRYVYGLQEFSAFLGKKPLHDLVIEGGAKS